MLVELWKLIPRFVQVPVPRQVVDVNVTVRKDEPEPAPAANSEHEEIKRKLRGG